jgi:leucyl aminopeptidase
MSSFAARANASTVNVVPLSQAAYKTWRRKASKRVVKWLDASGFSARAGKVALVPGTDGSLSQVILGLGRGDSLWPYAALANAVPEGRYQLDTKLGEGAANAAALGWALGGYRYIDYKSKAKAKAATLVWPKNADRKQIGRLYDGTALARDLVNAPAQDLGPGELATKARAVARKYQATCKVIKGDALLKSGYPAIHAVGRAGTPARAPRLIDIRWGKTKAPKLTLVGKGVVFDSGGMDLKPAASMRWMKKDMGGAASILALAQMVMDAKLPVRLRVLIPTVENAISPDAIRPGDVLQTRKGLTVEVGNTDAEGRLILCDALAEAASEKPDLILDIATLTGASRVALGSELPGYFCSSDSVAKQIDAATDVFDPDPLWRMPLFEPYRRHLESYIADIHNIANVNLGGAITAALFLREFVGKSQRWVHLDANAWNVSSQPGRPKGGEAAAVRRLYRFLESRYR